MKPIIKVKHMDTSAAMVAGIIKQFHTPVDCGDRRYSVIMQENHYSDQIEPLLGLNVAVGYSCAPTDKPIGPCNQRISLDTRTGGFLGKIWLKGTKHADYYSIEPFELDHTKPHEPVRYNPESIEVILVYTAKSESDPKAGFVVTEFHPVNNKLVNADWIIGMRPDGMDVKQARAWIRLKGYCDVVTAIKWVHILHTRHGNKNG